jgi:anthranilate phosphoribosyltransferase
VHGVLGLDELSPIGTTRVAEVTPSGVLLYEIDAADLFDTATFSLEQLAGGDPAYNAHVVRGVLNGALGGAARAAVTLNAGAALYVADRVDSIAEGVARAERVLDAGGGIAALERLRAATMEVGK